MKDLVGVPVGVALSTVYVLCGGDDHEPEHSQAILLVYAPSLMSMGLLSLVF